MMEQKIKEKWIAALRSGNYEQGQGALRRADVTGDKYCCLGVLCEIVLDEGIEYDNSEYPDENGPLERYLHEPDNSYYYGCNLSEHTIGKNGISTELPFWLAEKLGVNSDVEADLICLNDRDEEDFKRIANYIEENL